MKSEQHIGMIVKGLIKGFLWDFVFKLINPIQKWQLLWGE